MSRRVDPLKRTMRALELLGRAAALEGGHLRAVLLTGPAFDVLVPGAQVRTAHKCTIATEAGPVVVLRPSEVTDPFPTSRADYFAIALAAELDLDEWSSDGRILRGHHLGLPDLQIGGQA